MGTEIRSARRRGGLRRRAGPGEGRTSQPPLDGPAETGQPVSFFYSTDDEQAASDDEEAAQVEVTVTTYRGTPEMVAALMRQVEEIVNPAPVPV